MVRTSQRRSGQRGHRWGVLLAGRGFAIDDLDMWSIAADAASYSPVESDVLFELKLSEARCKGYGDVLLPVTTKWSAPPDGR